MDLRIFHFHVTKCLLCKGVANMQESGQRKKISNGCKSQKKIHSGGTYNHIVLEQPNNSGSQYRNYKGTDSIILMAVVGPENQFLYADVGLNDIRTKPLEKNTLNLPKPKSLFSDSDDISYVFVADDAFP